MDYPHFDLKYKSLMAKHLTENVFFDAINLKTKNNFTLEDVIRSGVINPDSGIGAYAGDPESYQVFKDFFNPLIEEYHGASVRTEHQSDFNLDNLDLPPLDPENNYIRSTRIRIGRNIEHFPLGPAITQAQRFNVEYLILTALCQLTGDLGGSYYFLDGMTKSERNQLIEDHFLFKAGDRFQEAAGLNRDWPQARGIFHNKDKTFLVWINEEDHLRMISMQRGGDIFQVFKRLSDATAILKKYLRFSRNKHLGYITSCPTNLGTAMRASVHIFLPKLSNKVEQLQKLTSLHNLQIRGVHGEHSSSHNAVFDISNKRRLGVTEVQCIKDLYNGVSALIKAEQTS